MKTKTLLYLRQEMLPALLLLSLIVATIMISIVWGDARSFGRSFWTIMNNAGPYVPLALGVAVVISCGEIDLSVAGLFSFSGMLTLGFASLQWSMPLVYTVVFAIALAIGIAIGFIVDRMGTPSIILTLGVSFLLYGLAFVINHKLIESSEQHTLPPIYLILIFNKSWPWVVGLIVLIALIRKFSLHWKHHIATGLDRNAAMLAGLPIGRVRVVAFAVSSLLCCVSAMLVMVGYNYGGWDVGTGRGKELTAIAAAVIGGTRITGGRLQPVNVALSVILWNSLLYLTYMIPAVTPREQEVVIGILVIAVSIIGSRK